MQSSDKVIEMLNLGLAIELTAVDQYHCQSRMCKNWGYHKLAQKHHEEMLGEMKHAEQLIDRILFLEGVPAFLRYDTICVGTTVYEQLENDLELERKGVIQSNEAIELCLQCLDSGSRKVLESILVESEEHVDWLESQLHLIETTGIQNYLAEQMGTE